jgi:hypothetical protein
MRFRSKTGQSLKKKAKKGFRGYPLATVAYYGPDNKFASKVVVGIFVEDDQMEDMQKWFSDDEDVRKSVLINRDLLRFIEEHGVKSVVITDGIIGCPHEEGIDYPKGEWCPQCPFWQD